MLPAAVSLCRTHRSYSPCNISSCHIESLRRPNVWSHRRDRVGLRNMTETLAFEVGLPSGTTMENCSLGGSRDVKLDPSPEPADTGRPLPCPSTAISPLSQPPRRPRDLVLAVPTAVGKSPLPVSTEPTHRAINIYVRTINGPTWPAALGLETVWEPRGRCGGHDAPPTSMARRRRRLWRNCDGRRRSPQRRSACRNGANRCHREDAAASAVSR